MENKYLNLAYQLALKASSNNEVPVGAVIIKDNKIIAKAYNQIESKGSSNKHAEIIALEKAFKKEKTKNLNGYEIYITLEPCLMCLGAIINAHIKTIYFSCLDNLKGAFTHYGINPSIDNLEIHYIKDEKASTLLSSFFKNKLR